MTFSKHSGIKLIETIVLVNIQINSTRNHQESVGYDDGVRQHQCGPARS
jgi:hypothetical protein